MTPVGVQRRRSALRAVGHRRPGGSGRSGMDASPRLFPDGASAAAAEVPASGREAPAAPASRLEQAARGEGATLEELVGRVWEGILTEGRAACPLCGGELVGRASAHARATEGRCRDCGTTIG